MLPNTIYDVDETHKKLSKKSVSLLNNHRIFVKTILRENPLTEVKLSKIEHVVSKTLLISLDDVLSLL